MRYNLNLFGALADVDRIVLNQVKRDNNTIYGARAIEKRLGLWSRPTHDYDILSQRPLKSAMKLEKTLDKISKEDAFYWKSSKHKGTYKVFFEGMDGLRGNDDDFHIADFSRPNRKHSVDKIHGINYVTLSDVRKDKQKSLRDRKYSYRHDKDRIDLELIRLHQKVARK